MWGWETGGEGEGEGRAEASHECLIPLPNHLCAVFSVSSLAVMITRAVPLPPPARIRREERRRAKAPQAIREDSQIRFGNGEKKDSHANDAAPDKPGLIRHFCIARAAKGGRKEGKAQRSGESRRGTTTQLTMQSGVRDGEKGRWNIASTPKRQRGKRFVMGSPSPQGGRDIEDSAGARSCLFSLHPKS